MSDINNCNFFGACIELLRVVKIDNNRINLHIILKVKTGVMFLTIHSQILESFQSFHDPLIFWTLCIIIRIEIILRTL